MKVITKEQYDQLPEFVQKNYTVQDDGSYALQLEGLEDVGALKRAKDHEKEKASKARERARKAEARLQELEEADEARKTTLAKKQGDIESIEKSWQKKYDEAVTSRDKTIEGLTGKLQGVYVDKVASEIAGDICTVPSLLAPIIKGRLSVDLESDTPTTRILDGQGNLSALTVDELKAEFQNNEEYKAVMIGSKASGGGKSDLPASNDASGDSGQNDFKSLSPSDKIKYLDSKYGKD